LSQGKERGEAPLPPGSLPIMPSLFRLLISLGLIGGIAYGTVFALANFVKYQPREIVVTIPNNQFLKQP
jgi:hypothetical protein